ncbi:hypothetical protein CDEST_06118 [Colletotrichum destructivum]|uniref:Major facilitator superfamily transporter n=1 Tax=Colletotrichum destructivum TaxID=34406 RepID=A0AAX4ICV7_9PEZI|nr:hypothetical protein CDEST_06118 [Colletotrichum destructivum]
MQYIKSAASARDQGYLDVAASASDAENGKKGMTMQQDRRRPWFTLSFLISTGLITALLLLLVVLQTDHTSKEVVSWPEFQGGSRVVADCGYSPEEAKAKGCVWDLMSFGWTHPACYNKAESEKWLNDFGPWKWYLDLNATQEVAEKDLPYTELVYAEQGYHVQHCLYVLKLLHLAAMTGHPVTDEAIPLAHTGHCTKMISDPAYLDFKHINTKVDLLLARCVTLD